MSVLPLLDAASQSEDPFPHAWIPRLFPTGASHSLHSWLSESDLWKRSVTDFYSQDEFSLLSVPPPPHLSWVTASSTLLQLSKWLHRTFGGPLPETKRCEVVAHRLKPGDRIGIHNDFLPEGETHRITYQVGQGSLGGVTMLFKTLDPDSVRRIVQPLHGTALAFPISQVSYHAVSRVESGERYTIVYSF